MAVGTSYTRPALFLVPLVAALGLGVGAETLDDLISATLSRRGVERQSIDWAYFVESLDTGEVLAARDADEPLKPASNLKLLTAGALLDTLGADYRFPTTVYADGARDGSTLRGDLWVVCLADPTFNGVHSPSASAALRNLADTIAESGIRRVTGDLVIAGLFAYADGLGAVRALGGGEADALALSAAEEDIGELTPTDLGTARIVSESAFAREASRAAGERLRDLLGESRGIEICGDVRFSARTRAPGVQVARRLSPPLGSIVRRVLHSSINLHSDLLLLHLGHQVNGELTLDAGISAARAWLASTGAPLDGFRMFDGSGLSHRNRMTARQLVAVLRHMDDSPAAAAWREALPLAGRSGTLSHRMKGTPAEGNLRGKTGTLTGAASLSGYVTSRGTGDRLAFAILENSPFSAPLSRGRARGAIDEIAVMIASGRGAGSGRLAAAAQEDERPRAQGAGAGGRAQLPIEESFASSSAQGSWDTPRGVELLGGIGGSSPEGDGAVGRLVRRGRGEAIALTGLDDGGDVAVEAHVHLSYNTSVNESPRVPYQGIVVRAEGDNWIRFVADFDRDRTLKLQTHRGGSWQRLATWTFPRDFPDPGGEGWHTLRLEVRGNTLVPFFDGQRLPGDPIAFQGFRQGRAGIYAYHWGGQSRDTRVAHFDDFRIEPLVPASAVAASGE